MFSMNAGDGSFYDLRLIVPPSVLSSFNVDKETFNGNQESNVNSIVFTALILLNRFTYKV